MKRRTLIVGYGELVYDHLFAFENEAEVGRYVGSRGGGCVWNVLVNLAVLGAEVKAAGAYGKDRFGSLACAELRAFGIDCSGVHAAPRGRTRVIFERLFSAVGQAEVPLHKFGIKCEVCCAEPADSAIARAREYVHGTIHEWRPGDALVVDRLTGDRLEIAAAARSCGAATILDLGRVGYLWRVRASQLIYWMSLFDVVLMPALVQKWLAGRLAAHGERDLIRCLFRRDGCNLIIVSDGQNGVTCWLRQAGAEYESLSVGSQAGQPISDTAGAGDHFLAHMIWGFRRVADREHSGFVLPSSIGEVHSVVRRASEAVGDCIAALGARGHLECKEEGDLTAYAGLTTDNIRLLLADSQECQFCGVSSHQIKRNSSATRRPGMASNVLTYLRSRILSSVERVDAADRLRRALRAVRTIYVIGTGGSFSAALFVAQALTRYGYFAQALRPYDYHRVGGEADMLMVISRSGGTSDCGIAIRSAVARDVKRVVLITASPNPDLGVEIERELIGRGTYSHVCYAPGRSPERGFISWEGTVSPCAVVVSALGTFSDAVWLNETIERALKEQYHDRVQRLLDELRGTMTGSVEEEGKGVVHVFGGGWAWPGMVDLESKLTEGNIGTAHLHESKDFSHGRFMLTMGERYKCNTKIFIGVGKRDEYEKKLVDVLCKNGELIEINAEGEQMLGGLECLIKIQYFVHHLAKTLGKDIARPRRIPQDGLTLYRWQKLRP